MKLSFLSLFSLVSLTESFSIVSSSVARRRAADIRPLHAAEYEPVEGESRINHKIDLDSEKVVNMEELEKGKKVYCRCWLSGTFPLCDGTHAKHNDAIGDNVGPLIVTVKKE